MCNRGGMRAATASLFLPAFLFAASLTAPAFADSSAENKAAARSLGIEGIQLARQGDCVKAIPLLERAETLFHAPTILGTLGECQVKVGRLVEGTENLNRVSRETLAADAPTAFVQAQERARVVLAEAQPKIGRLTIIVKPEGLTDVKVSVGGQAVSSALIGAPRPTDPGEREVVVSAPGYLTVKQTVTLAEGGSEMVELTLAPDPNASSASDAGTSSAAGGTSAPSNGMSTQRILGYTGVGLGGALLIGGGITGIMAVSKKSSLEDSCPDPKNCSDGDTLDSANTLATVSTIFSIAGGVIGAGGLVLILTDDTPSSERAVAAEPRLAAVVGPSSLALRGSF
jgi:hypothetical protein